MRVLRTKSQEKVSYDKLLRIELQERMLSLLDHFISPYHQVTILFVLKVLAWNKCTRIIHPEAW